MARWIGLKGKTVAKQKKNGGEGITWTDETWNPVRGCSRVSEGCRNCYAEKQAARIISMNRGRGIEEGSGAYDGLIAKGGQWNGKMELVPKLLDQPLRWRNPRKIFVNSMSDLFHENVPFEYVAAAFGIMAGASWHTFQILTKRPGRMREFFQWIDSHPERSRYDTERLKKQCPGDDWRVFFMLQKASEQLELGGKGLRVEATGQWPLPNVWLGVSVEDQKAANERIPLLLDTPAAVRWISAEPLLGPVNLRQIMRTTPDSDWVYCWDSLSGFRGHKCGGTEGNPALDWVVVGGESGANARPMEREWVRSLRDQCALNSTAFHFKQWGEFAPNWMNDEAGNEIEGSAWTDRMGKRIAGRMLDGVTHDGYPGEQAMLNVYYDYTH